LYFDRGSKWILSICKEQTIINETTLAYLFTKDCSELVEFFPIMPLDGFNKNYDQLGFYIDPFAYGQWLGGRRIEPGIPWANETDYVGHELLLKRLTIDMYYNGTECRNMPIINNMFPLATLHMHCKRGLDKWL
jgi:hypothetical protein